VNDRPDPDRVGCERKRCSELASAATRAVRDQAMAAKMAQALNHDRWAEAQQEDPERWDGMG